MVFGLSCSLSPSRAMTATPSSDARRIDEVFQAGIEASREWCALSKVPDDDYRSRAAFAAGFAAGSEWKGAQDAHIDIYIEAVRLMYDQTGCDCDASLAPEERWHAEAHASDCPVYERWSVIEPELMRALSGVESSDEGEADG
jgi:hypothetical protein